MQMTMSSQERNSLKHLYSFQMFNSFFIFLIFNVLISRSKITGKGTTAS